MPEPSKNPGKAKARRARLAKTPPSNGNGGHLAEGAMDVGSLLRALRAYENGDFSVRMPLDWTGPAAEVAAAFNHVVAQSEYLAAELQRLNSSVGKEGRLGQRASARALSGSWKASVDSLNGLIDDLAQPTAEVGRVIGAVAAGDLTQTMAVEIEGRPLKGEFLRTAKVVNWMVGQLDSFAAEVTRVAREVGTEGKLGGQAQVKGVSGTWKDLTESVNLMAGNLTAQVRNIAEVTTAVARGDLSRKITVDVRGEILELKNTVNTMVDQLNAFASEVSRVAREVGTEGKLGGQAHVRGAAGTWKDLTDNVNSMAGNLTAQVRNIAEVTTAVARGDLSRKITVDVEGEILELKVTINTMVDQLRDFAAEVTRVAREVGTDGKLGGQAQVEGVAGTWKDLTDSVNFMASNLTAQVRNIAEVTTAVANGDLSRKITVDVKGEILELKNTINTMVDQLNAFASEVTRVAREVGTEGKLGGQAQVRGVAGVWKDLTDNVNSMASNLTSQVRNIAEVTTAVAKGDLSRKITVDVKGEILELKNTVNTMVDQLNAFASEVTRVAREVGTEGKLGGQAEVRGVAGVWKDLTDNVNSMAANLTNQVRRIAMVVTAVAGGDLKQKLALEARGEIAKLAETINSMTDTLATFAEQATTVAREVGVEGKLGGQAKVPGASGTWKDLVDNVNQLAGNLTTQVRAIGDVATAVTKGDLTQTIAVEASGEVAALKDNINEMIRALRETTQKTTEQDWLKTHLARFSRMLQGQRDVVTVARQVLSELAPLVAAQYGTFYVAESDGDAEESAARLDPLKLLASFAAGAAVQPESRFQRGEGLIGQCALEKRRHHITDVPPDYLRIRSGLGSAGPTELIVLPVLFEGRVNAVIELASFSRFSEIHLAFFDQLTESIGIVVNTISASMRTEALLKQSQLLTEELQFQQEELRQTNERLQRQAAFLRESEERLRTQQEELQRTNEQLADKAQLLEVKNREVESAKSELEEKADQLALTSKYKSQFLANMSHELRTPLNSLLILSKMLADDPEGNLSSKHVEFSKTIHSAGTELLGLINDILDLSKIESGMMQVEISNVSFRGLGEYVEQNFGHVAQQKALELAVITENALPPSLVTDPKRLQQVLKNLLSNALKFTETGGVTLRMRQAFDGWSRDHEILNQAERVIAFEVADTGIGIAPDKQRIIFEAFQQEDGTTSRKYGGTGLGLSISRELARLLGGEIRVSSRPSEGSTFTLYLPQVYLTSDGEAITREMDRPLVRNARAASPEEPTSGSRPVIDAPSWAGVDDREAIGANDRVLVIIEDYDAFARILLSAAREKGFKAIVAADGDEGLALARRFRPAGVTLDLHLPDVDGWVLLDQLKHDATTRHIPVIVLSGETGNRHRALAMGAMAYLEKPVALDHVLGTLDEVHAFVEARVKNVLIVEDDDRERASITALLAHPGVEITAVATGRDAIAALRDGRYHCMVLDLGLSDMSGVELLESLHESPLPYDVPVIVHTGRPLARREETELRRLAGTIVIKDGRSPERLLAETTLFLHSADEGLPPYQRRAIAELHGSAALADITVLVVDDDVRNIFAVTSALERHRASVCFAESGRDALSRLDSDRSIDVVLMDIMMPEMDGYEAIRRIRADSRFASLPIIALTAKAMKADRDKCLQAGASDYIAKPVDVERLVSMIRVCRGRAEAPR